MPGTMLTAAGNAMLANAAGLGSQIDLAEMAVGDGGGAEVVPSETQTALFNEVYRAALNDIEKTTDGEGNTVLSFVLVIPAAQGGFTVREAGVFAADGTLFCVAPIPPSYKPELAEGAASELRIKLELTFSTELENVTLKIDPTVVLASRDYVDQHAERTDDPHDTIPEGGDPGQVLIRQEDGSLAWGTVGGVPVGQLCWSTGAAPLPGTIPVNVPQVVLCAAYPDLFEYAKNSGNIVTKAEWDALAAVQNSVPKYWWDGNESFGLPLIRDYVGAARPGEAGKGIGDWAEDAIRNITGDATWQTNTGLTEPAGAKGAFFANTPTGHYGIQNTGTANTPHSLGFDASLEVPTADENRPKTSYMLPCIKAYDAVINSAQVDLVALADMVAQINGNKVDRADWVELVPGMAWKMPNGLVMQCGISTAPTTSSGTFTFAFPVSFPNGVLSLIPIDISSTPQGQVAWNNTSTTPSTGCVTWDGVSLGVFSWTAIGN